MSEKKKKIKQNAIMIPLERLMDGYDGTTEEWRGGTYEQRRDIIKRLPLGRKVSVKRMSASKTNLTEFNNIIKRLQEAGLDLGKGDAEYGYGMPIPKSNDSYRELIIFRRR